MQARAKSAIYKKLFLASLALLVIGIVLVVIGLSSLYGAVSKCGFGSGTCAYSSTSGNAAIAGGYMSAIDFTGSFIFLIIYLVARSKEKASRHLE